LRSFLEEARLLARIRHPNIVAVLNFAKANRTAYLVMRHETGHTLETHMVDLRKRRVAIDEAYLRLVFVRLLSGLREVHKEKLLHLDLKPANIFLRQDGNPVLLDFGAARWGLGAADSSLGYVYTPGFAAPEQQGSGEPLGPWTDIYAIGATLYACLSGEQGDGLDLRAQRETIRGGSAPSASARGGYPACRAERWVMRASRGSPATSSLTSTWPGVSVGARSTTTALTQFRMLVWVRRTSARLTSRAWMRQRSQVPSGSGRRVT
jgi:serine/threonine protein kinase